MIDKTDCRLEQRSCWAFCVVSVSVIQPRLNYYQVTRDYPAPTGEREFGIFTPGILLSALSRCNWLIQKPKYLQHLLSHRVWVSGDKCNLRIPDILIFYINLSPLCDLLGEEFYCFNVETFSYFLQFFITPVITIHIPDWNEITIQTSDCYGKFKKKKRRGNHQEPHPWSDHLGTGENCKNIGNHGLRGVLSRMTGMPFVVTAGAYLLHTQSPIILTVDRANHPSGSCVVKWRERTRGANCFNRFLQATYGWSSLKCCLRRAS